MFCALCTNLHKLFVVLGRNYIRSEDIGKSDGSESTLTAHSNDGNLVARGQQQLLPHVTRTLAIWPKQQGGAFFAFFVVCLVSCVVLSFCRLSFVVCLLSLILHKNWWWWRQSLAIKYADILSAAYRWTFNKPLGRWMRSSLSISHADYIKDTQAHTNTHYNLISDLNLPLSFASCRWRGCTLSSRPFWRCTIMW